MRRRNKVEIRHYNDIKAFVLDNKQQIEVETTNSRTRRRGRTRKRTTTMANANPPNTKMANANPQKTIIANANRPYVPLSSSLSSTVFKSRSSSTIFAIFVVNIVQQQMNSGGGVEAVRCYCTDEHCVPYGVCEAAVCLVGLLRANNAVIRTCGNEALGCRRNVDRWSHICSCDQHFCNTFHFLRANTNIDGSGSTGAAPENGRGSSNTMPMMEQSQHHQQQQMSSNGEEDDRRVFERIDQSQDGFAIFDHQMADNDAEQHERTIKNSQLLTLLLVIVPLSVGAAAVVVVSINSYCHLC